jgi:fructose-1-phosphate kinase PfkB-like protein
LEELEQLVGYRPTSLNDIITAGRQILAQGVKVVVISLGAEGAVTITEESAWRLRAPEVAAISTVGCGDAMVAGCAVSLATLGSEPEGKDILDAVILGTAAAASNALSPCAGDIKVQEVNAFLGMVGVEEL